MFPAAFLAGSPERVNGPGSWRGPTAAARAAHRGNAHRATAPRAHRPAVLSRSLRQALRFVST
jgi:hypothetical protein